MANRGTSALKYLAAACAAFGLSAGAFGQVGTGDPDVIVGDLDGVSTYGTLNTGVANDNWIYAYAVGTVSCNIATVNNVNNDLSWVSSTNRHPVIGQNMYRLRVVGGATRLEMIGQSWLKHGFTALTQSLCATCSGRGGPQLGVGCSDPYSSGLNGSQDRLGPRSHVNASTGVFPYPFTTPGAGYLVPPAYNTATNSPDRRLQVHRSDVNPTQNTNTRYFVEGQYVEQDDSSTRTTGRGTYPLSTNNASYRRITITNNTTFSATVADTTKRQLPAINAWRDYGGRDVAGNFNNTADAAVTITPLDFNTSGDGRYLVGYKVTDLGGGTWRYEFAVQNLTSDRAGGEFKIPVPAGVTITNQSWHGTWVHSGEIYATKDWVGSVSGGFVRWVVPDTFAANPNSSALRWGNLYNFSFDANRPPVAANAELVLFKPGSPSSGLVAVQGPSAPPCPCAADFDNSGGTPDVGDIDAFFSAWLAGDPTADVDCSGGTPDVGDVDLFFGQWLAGGC